MSAATLDPRGVTSVSFLTLFSHYPLFYGIEGGIAL